jgi:uncharacterized protein (DUF1800 family)
MAVAWNYDNAAHLLRRAAFGGTPEEIQRFLERHDSVEGAVEELLSFPESRSKPPARRRDDRDTLRHMQRWWLGQMLRTRRPRDACREKLVLFLHDHLTSGIDKQPEYRWLAYQNQLFRRRALGDFRALVRDFNRDMANLFFLDGILNNASDDGVRVNANENWGRELLELFTLGVFQYRADGTPDPSTPNYTERDVHNVARASTGWVGEPARIGGVWQGTWVERRWDGGRYDDDGDGRPDPMVIFDRSSNGFRLDDAVAGTPDDVLDLVFSRTDDDGNNQVGMFLSERLWTWYAYPPPAPGLKGLWAGCAAAFAAGEFRLSALLRSMWTQDEFYGEAARTRTVKHPVDYVVQAFKVFGARGNGREIGDRGGELADRVARMGMELFNPPNVAGWPGGLNWITSGTLIERLDFAKDLAAADFGANRIQLERIVGLPWGDGAADPAVVVDALLHQVGLDVGPGAVMPVEREALLDYATDYGARTSLDLSHAYTEDAGVKVRGLIALILQMPECHLQ